MDFLSRYVAHCALACALGLVSLPAFAVLDSPNYSWRLGQSGNVYNVYDPQGPHLSNNFTPNSSFAENSASNGVIETVTPGPLTIDGATGEILNGVSLSRGLTVGDLIDGAKALMVPDNPYGAAFLGLSLVATLAWDAYETSIGASPSSPSVSQPFNPSLVSGCTQSPVPAYVCPSTESNEWFSSSGAAALGGFIASNQVVDYCIQSSGSVGTTSSLITCSTSSLASSQLSSIKSQSSSETPSQAIQWAQANPSSFATNVAPTLNGSPADQIALANDLANSNAPLSTPSPYGYTIPSTDATVQGSPTTTSSTDPSTGQTTNTTSTPSYKFTTPTPPNGVQVQKTTQIVTQTCTSAGSCTTTNTTTNTAPATQPKLGSFIAPTTSVPPSNTSSIKSFALNLAMPSQSNAVCPSPLSFNAFSNTFTIPLTPLCTLATDVRPYVESLGAVGAGIVIFR